MGGALVATAVTGLALFAVAGTAAVAGMVGSVILRLACRLFARTRR